MPDVPASVSSRKRASRPRGHEATLRAGTNERAAGQATLSRHGRACPGDLVPDRPESWIPQSWITQSWITQSWIPESRIVVKTMTAGTQGRPDEYQDVATMARPP